MTLNGLSEEKREAILKQFNFEGDFDFLDIIADIVDSTEGSTEYEVLLECVDEAFCYHNCQWTLARHYYSSPFDLNGWEELYDKIISDIYKINSGTQE